jgi:hypothetical protein
MGGQSARVGLIGSDGAELSARVDADVVATCQGALGTRCLVVALVIVDVKGRTSIDAMWTADDLLASKKDKLVKVLCQAPKTRPGNPGLVLARSRIDRRFVLEGWVVRRRHHVDKNGGRMLTVGLLGGKGYARFFVFASRRPGADVKHLKRDAHVIVRVRKLSGDAAHLTGRQVIVL